MSQLGRAHIPTRRAELQPTSAHLVRRREARGVTFALRLLLAAALCTRLVVEVDGAHHALRRGADARRVGALAAAGLRVMRLPASLVTGNLAAALVLIGRALRA